VARFLLEAQNVELSYGGTQILFGVSLGIHPGEFFVLLGPSGSGKSTLLKTLTGIARPDRGKVLLRGDDLGSLAGPQLAQSVGSVPQDDIIHTGLKLGAALEYAARLRLPADSSEDAIGAAVGRVLKAIELEHRANVRIGKLSGGQRKRASLGIELLQAPPVLLLDEPTSGLDPDLERTTMQLLRRLADEGRAVMTTTHSTASLDLADALVVLVQGHLAWAGPPKAALSHFGVSDPDLIFKALRQGTPASWAKKYAQSPVGRVFRGRAGAKVAS
jgi:ABC-type multidrug transport system ATPase subunit